MQFKNKLFTFIFKLDIISTQNKYKSFPEGTIYIKGVKMARGIKVVVVSFKGGVGKTNFTVNLAIALAMYGKKILIIDADLGMANVDVILGTAPQYNLLNLLIFLFSLIILQTIY